MWAYDFKTQKRIARRVKHLIPGETKTWVHLLTSQGEIVATPGHDFWVESLGEWRDAQDLPPEMELRISEGKITYLISLHIEELDSFEATYNFEVEENHNYYVGQEGILVHNEGCGTHRASPALKGDPYHPDEVAKRVEGWKQNRPTWDAKSINQITIERAASLGYPTRIRPQAAPFNSMGEPAFFNGKNYISRDRTQHDTRMEKIQQEGKTNGNV